MGAPYKMKGSPMQRNFGVGTESPVKQAGLVKLAIKAGKKVYKGVKKVFKANKAKSTEPTYFNVKTGRHQSTPSGNVHKKGDTYSKTYPHYRTNR